MTSASNFKETPLPRFWNKTAIILFVLSLAGLALSIISWLRICSEACADSHNYRLFGFQFETIGLFFFSSLLITQILSRKIKNLSLVTPLLIGGAFGGELMFTYAQKYIIGHWCPICLSIATVVTLAATAILFSYFSEINTFINQGQKVKAMKSITRSILFLSAVIFGFFMSLTGFAKFDKLQAAENSIKDSIAFGNLKSPIEVYVFTDWECPSCRKIEPLLTSLAPEIMKNARLIFVDFTIHAESMNFTPYNLSFMIKDKANYLRLRDLLTAISVKTGTPTDTEIEEALKPLGIKYEQLNYADVAVGIKYFKHTAKQFDIDSTPTVVIVNSTTKKGKKLVGANEITKEHILSGMDALK